MDLFVCVIEARGLPTMDLEGLTNSYVKLHLGKCRKKTKVVKKNLTPVWGWVTSVRSCVSPCTNEDKYFNDDFIGHVKVALSQIFDAQNRSLGTTWYHLQPKKRKSKMRNCGEVCLTISFTQKSSFYDGRNHCHLLVAIWNHPLRERLLKAQLLRKIDNSNTGSPVDLFYQIFLGKKVKAVLLSNGLDSSEVLQDILLKSGPDENQGDNVGSNIEYDELLKIVQLKDQGGEMPGNLLGGILLNQPYAVESSDLNSILFSPSSNVLQSMAEHRGTIDLQPGPWRLENDGLRRVITYTNAASKLIRAVKATEEQIYLKTDGNSYAVLASVSTPDVPCGSYFKTQILYRITPGVEFLSGNQSSHLVISWRVNFLQSTMMKGMIESGARQGLMDSFAQFADILSQIVKPVDSEGSDHGLKAQGDAWLLTVALIEGSNLATLDSSEFSDPYVVFTCNGKTKTSSIKFQTSDPQWNEVFQFDAMGDPPSMMDVVVYDFDGPFDDAVSLGLWISLHGKCALACQSKLHLKIFLNNTRGTEVVTEYLTKVEKEVGKKINLRSPQTNSAFQKLFSLPSEEFLINDFTCHLKRKMPLQGRLFLSARIIGFYANLFGRKVKFFFLWEDVDGIQVNPPSLASVGSPSLMITLRKGRGMDAKHGAKVDKDGRLKFHFQSFVSFQVANRTIMALWRARSLSPEQKVQIVEIESETKFLYTEETGTYLGIEDAKKSEVFCSVLPVSADSLLEMFDGGPLERKVMESVGCVDYSVTPWEPVKTDICQRHIGYKFEKSRYHYGGEITSTQQKLPLPDSNGWIIEEVMTLQGVLLGDYFSG